MDERINVIKPRIELLGQDQKERVKKWVRLCSHVQTRLRDSLPAAIGNGNYVSSASGGKDVTFVLGPVGDVTFTLEAALF